VHLVRPPEERGLEPAELLRRIPADCAGAVARRLILRCAGSRAPLGRTRGLRSQVAVLVGDLARLRR
jgi:hypothetical protein